MALMLSYHAVFLVCRRFRQKRVQNHAKTFVARRLNGDGCVALVNESTMTYLGSSMASRTLNMTGRLATLTGTWIVLAGLSVSPTLAETTRPFWTEQAMFRFGEHLFFVGQASCAKTAEEGRQKAFGHALQELRNYTQAETATVTAIETQMTYEERNTPGCPSGTLTTWRLLKIGTDTAIGLSRKASVLRKPASGKSRHEQVTLQIGMFRDEVFEHLGRPSSITLRQDNELTWEYRRIGLIVQFDRHFTVTGWSPIGTETQWNKSSRDVFSSASTASLVLGPGPPAR